MIREHNDNYDDDVVLQYQVINIVRLHQPMINYHVTDCDQQP